MNYFLTDLAQSPLLQRTVVAILLSAIACGIVGGYVVVRRNTYMVGAVSHSLLGGIGLALLLQRVYSCSWLSPSVGALIAAILIASLITAMSHRWNIREDTVLSAIWALGMAIGISAIVAIPGYPPDLNGYLFGNIMLTSFSDLIMIGILDLAILIAVFFYHQRIVIYSFNPELLVLRGISTSRIALILNLLIAFTVVILSQLSGLILCLALMVLPAATAAIISRRLPIIMLLGAIICLICAFSGLILSYSPLTNGTYLATGPTIVEISGLIFIIALAIRWLKRKYFCRQQSKIA